MIRSLSLGNMDLLVMLFLTMYFLFFHFASPLLHLSLLLSHRLEQTLRTPGNWPSELPVPTTGLLYTQDIFTHFIPFLFFLRYQEIDWTINDDLKKSHKKSVNTQHKGLQNIFD